MDPTRGAYRPPAVGVHGAVSAAHGLAATAGLRILMQGGNAVDAAVAVGAALSVVEPFMSGLGGGGGFMTIHERGDGSVHVLDYVGRTPGAADPTAFSSLEALERGYPFFMRTWHSGRLARRPRPLRHPRPRGRLSAGDRAGRARLADHIVRRAHARRTAATASAATRARARPTSLKGVHRSRASWCSYPIWLRPTAPLATDGADAFYRGEIGQRLVRAVQAAGGWLTEADLAAFTPVWLEPLVVDFRGYRVHMPPPPCARLPDARIA